MRDAVGDVFVADVAIKEEHAIVLHVDWCFDIMMKTGVAGQGEVLPEPRKIMVLLNEVFVHLDRLGNTGRDRS